MSDAATPLTEAQDFGVEARTSAGSRSRSTSDARAIDARAPRRRRPAPCCARCPRGSGRPLSHVGVGGRAIGRIRQITSQRSVMNRRADSTRRRARESGRDGRPATRPARPRPRRARAPTGAADWRRSCSPLRERLEVLRDPLLRTRQGRARCRRRAAGRRSAPGDSRAAAPLSRARAPGSRPAQRLPCGVVLLERLGAGRRPAPLVLLRRRHVAPGIGRPALEAIEELARLLQLRAYSSLRRVRSPPPPPPACDPRCPWRPSGLGLPARPPREPACCVASASLSAICFSSRARRSRASRAWSS